VRERWFGATGRRVREICVEGELDLDDALVLENVKDDDALRAAHAAGRPVVIRTNNATDIKKALKRPEVSCAMIPASRRELLDLDLRDLTYG
jgi:hypothetical protein